MTELLGAVSVHAFQIDPSLPNLYRENLGFAVRSGKQDGLMTPTECGKFFEKSVSHLISPNFAATTGSLALAYSGKRRLVTSTDFQTQSFAYGAPDAMGVVAGERV